MRSILHGDFVTLRPLTVNDMETRSRWTADAELSLLMGCAAVEPNHRSFEEETRANREWLEQRHRAGAMPYAIEVDGRYVGDVDYGVYPEKGMADLTVLIGERADWGKGYGTQAVELIVAEFLSIPEIETIEVDVAPCNDRALRFWRRMGFSDHHTDANGARFLRRQRHV
jgi:RimJ/RimL family protein N-acetyltransferase